MICPNTLNEGAPCPQNARYCILENDTYHFGCRNHILKTAFAIFGERYDTLDSIPTLLRIDIFQREAPLAEEMIVSCKDKISELINQELILGEELPPLYGFSRFKTNLDGWIMEINTSLDNIENIFIANCIHVNANRIESDLFIEIYKRDNGHAAKIVYDSHYFQLRRHYYPFNAFAWSDEDIHPFAMHMCDMLERLHTARICHGHLNPASIGFLDLSDPTSARFTSAMGITFWKDSYGRYIHQMKRLTTPNKHITSCVRLDEGYTTGRYDDYESLLYLILILQEIPLPWLNMHLIKDVILSKKQFIEDPSVLLGYHDSIDAISQICEMIRSSSFDSSPDYYQLKESFKTLALRL